VSSTTGLIFSYAIGLIFLVGGIVFILFLDDNRFTFGIPYLVLGLTIVYGMYSGRKRKKRREAREAAAMAEHGPQV
jgi:Ca2+/Na+ antiporter